MISIAQELKKPGQLVKFRGRRCVVQSSTDDGVILLKPLGASDDETMAVYEPVMQPHDVIEKDYFEYPSVTDLDNFLSAKLLYDAARLSFRQVSGPFRCMGKLSFRPRAYQLVPLIMTLKQQTARLLIADDVGIGKTIEALLILREFIERGIIKRFAVLCPPHLCEQWQSELADKLDIEAEIIRSSTVASLERRIIGDETQNVFNYFPYQVISFDYVKSENKKAMFLPNAPELIIVDEAHTCARPANQRDNQHQRFKLINELAGNANRHLLLLTATPHSGKDLEFMSLLGLLKKEFETTPLSSLSIQEKRTIAGHFIQRKRKNILTWLDEETPFPERISYELPYKLSPAYFEFYSKLLNFARGLTSSDLSQHKARMKYWAALALLRGVMSSPASGYDMLMNRRSKSDGEEWSDVTDNPILEKWDENSDASPGELISSAGLDQNEWRQLTELASKIENLQGPSRDYKIREAITQVKKWLSDKDQEIYPIIFCRFIATAHYVAAQLKAHLGISGVDIRAITSELSDDERREKIEEMGKSPRRILVATDCLSEGINLQDQFNAILHYDLPWNPNRLEQREGRVDRYGQASPKVDVRVLFGEDNPIDVVVLKILIEKIKFIQNQSGVNISLADDNRSIMDKVLAEVLLNPAKAQKQMEHQLEFDFSGDGDELAKLDIELTNEIEMAKAKAELIRSIFAHDNVKPEDVKQDLNEVDEAIGDVATLESFVVQACHLLGAVVEKIKDGYVFRKVNMDQWLAESLGNGDRIHISFLSPTPRGFRYIGRNSRFVENLCHRLLADALDPGKKGKKASRAAVFRSGNVNTQTVLIQFRVRNVIREVGSKQDSVTEEMFLWGYEKNTEGIVPLPYDRCKELLMNSNALDISMERQQLLFTEEMEHFRQLNPDFIMVVTQRAEKLVEAHTRFAKYLGARRYEAATPVLPPDVLGIYILIPDITL